MSVIALEQNIEDEQSGEIRGLVLAAVKYVGEHSSLAPRGALNTQGKWPGTALLNRGNWNFALIPDEGLAYLENRDDLEIVYADDREGFAATLLEQNRLPENVFGRGANRDLRQRVEAALDLESPAQAGPYEDQLREIAGVEEEPTDDSPDQDRAPTLVEEHSRSELKAAVKAIREDADEYSLRGDGSHATSMAEYLADQDEAVVHDALDAAEEGED